MNSKADILSRDPRHKSENNKLKIDLQNILFLIAKLLEQYRETEDQPRLIELSSLKQTEFRDLFKPKYQTNYTKAEQDKLPRQIRHINIYKKDGIFLIQNRLHLPAMLNTEIIEKQHSIGY